MSDAATTNDYLQRISSLAAEAKGHRLAHRETKKSLADVQGKLDKALADLKTVTADRDGLKQRLDAAPGELQTKVTELQGQLRDRDHRDAFKALYGDATMGINPDVPVETLMRELKYEAKADQPDASAIKAVVSGARETHRYLFGQAPADAGKSQAAPAAPAVPPAGPGLGRGGLSTDSGGMVVKHSQLQNAAWMYENQAKMAEAQSKGLLSIVSG